MLLMLMPLLTSCSKSQITGKRLDFPRAGYYGVYFLNGKVTAFISRADRSIPARSKIEYSSEMNPNINYIELPIEDKCTRFTGYGIAGLLPDGRLAVSQWCAGEYPEAKGSLADRTHLMAYRWDTGELEYLKMNNSLGIISWNPVMTLGIQEYTNRLSGTLYWTTRDMSYPMDIKITDDGVTWNLKDYYLDWDANTGIAQYPAWSSDGNTIVFFASGDAMYRSGFDRPDGEYKLYSMDPKEKKPTPILEGVYEPYLLEWSPNSQWLAFIGEYGLLRTHGIWVYSVGTQEIFLVAEGPFSDFEWASPNSILAVRRVGFTDDKLHDIDEIWEYDVSSIYQK